MLDADAEFKGVWLLEYMPSASERRYADAPQESSSRILNLLAPHMRAGLFRLIRPAKGFMIGWAQLDHEQGGVSGPGAEPV